MIYIHSTEVILNGTITTRGRDGVAPFGGGSGNYPFFSFMYKFV